MDNFRPIDSGSPSRLKYCEETDVKGSSVPYRTCVLTDEIQMKPLYDEIPLHIADRYIEKISTKPRVRKQKTQAQTLIQSIPTEATKNRRTEVPRPTSSHGWVRQHLREEYSRTEPSSNHEVSGVHFESAWDHAADGCSATAAPGQTIREYDQRKYVSVDDEQGAGFSRRPQLLPTRRSEPFGDECVFLRQSEQVYESSSDEAVCEPVDKELRRIRQSRSTAEAILNARAHEHRRDQLLSYDPGVSRMPSNHHRESGRAVRVDVPSSRRRRTIDTDVRARDRDDDKDSDSRYAIRRSASHRKMERDMKDSELSDTEYSEVRDRTSRHRQVQSTSTNDAVVSGNTKTSRSSRDIIRKEVADRPHERDRREKSEHSRGRRRSFDSETIRRFRGHYACAGGVQIGGRRLTNLRYADDIILIAGSASELQDLVAVCSLPRLKWASG